MCLSEFADKSPRITRAVCIHNSLHKNFDKKLKLKAFGTFATIVFVEIVFSSYAFDQSRFWTWPIAPLSVGLKVSWWIALAKKSTFCTFFLCHTTAISALHWTRKCSMMVEFLFLFHRRYRKHKIRIYLNKFIELTTTLVFWSEWWLRIIDYVT